MRTRYLVWALAGMPIGYFIVDRVGYVAEVEGSSMQPTLNPDVSRSDYVFLNRWATRKGELQHGEIVSLVSPKKPNEVLIKRVIGLSGDTVLTRGRIQHILEVPEGHCWVEGDNTKISKDSNTFGPIPLDSVLAKATHIVWPPSRWQSLQKRNSTMKAVRFRKNLQWELPGTVWRHGLTIGDIDNDGDNELVVGTAEGELYIFKGSELWQKITDLGLITSVVIGDIFNYGRNALVVICGDGWANIFYSPRSVNPSRGNLPSTQPSLNKDPNEQDNSKTTTTGHSGMDTTGGQNTVTSLGVDQVDGTTENNELSGKMECVHVQRIPTNTKVALVADVDMDGANEMILGLTDRVVRSYRWSSNPDGTGKLVGLNKWECADQIGTIALQHAEDGTPTLLVSQPGGVFMRIKCNPEDRQPDDEESCEASGEATSSCVETAASCVEYQTMSISRLRNQNISTEIIGDLGYRNSSGKNHRSGRRPRRAHWYRISSEATIPTDSSVPRETPDDEKDISFDQSDEEKNDDISSDEVDGNMVGGNIILGEPENIADVDKGSLLPGHKDFTWKNSANAKEPEISRDEQTEPEKKVIDKPKQQVLYALATLDGTIILMKDDLILWSRQVDNPIFALSRLDVTGDGFDEIVACAWDGQTYIWDLTHNGIRFKFEEPVRAFCAGQYNVSPGIPTPCLVYNTFNNKLVLYYDVKLPSTVLTHQDILKYLEPEERKNILELFDRNVSESERDRRMQIFSQWLLYQGAL